MPETDLPTIFALSSGHGRAGVAVIRLSGPRAGGVLDRMAGPRPKPRFAGLRKIRHPETGELLDEALVLWFPGPRSETGEDMAELHIHGGGAVLRAVLQAISVVPGCRLAEAGEFARRAFENGRIDLTAAEGLADLVDAETDAQRRQALAQSGGVLQRLYDGWREALLEGRALVEAAIDFSDEADVALDALAQAKMRLAGVREAIERHLEDANRGELVRQGFRVAIAGAPNAGKSSLLNALARRDVAIVSAEAGTTRDVVEVRLDLGGYAVVVSDTAGMRAAAGAIEQEGIRRAVARAQEAELVLWVADATAPAMAMPRDIAELAGRVLVVANKIDVAGAEAGAGALARLMREAGQAAEVLRVSALTGAGLHDLTQRIAQSIEARVGKETQPPPSQTRHREHLAACVAALRRFEAGDMGQAELRAEDLRMAANALGRITGRIGVEDVLGVIFGRFCIGK